MTMFTDGYVLARPLAAAPKVEQGVTEQAFFESLEEDAFLESIEKAARMGIRAEAAAACLEWANAGDASFGALDNVLYGLSGADEDGQEEMTDRQVALYESLQAAASEFLMLSDAQGHDIALAEEDELAACRIFESVENAMVEKDSDEVIAEFAVRESMILEATKKVVRNGEIVVIKTNKRKRRMSPAQKAALKKARKKAGGAAAKAARKKAARLRKSMGL